MKQVKVCVIGTGRLSTNRIYPYIAPAGGYLAGCCSRKLEHVVPLAERYGASPYTDVDEMLSREKPDAVLVCVGPSEHASLAKKILRMGFPVYTEKPPALSAEEALEVARVSKETRVLCSTAFKKRYANAYLKAKEWLSGYEPENFYSISADYASGAFSNSSQADSFLLDFSLHIIDLAVYLFGGVESVFCFSKGENAYAVSLKFQNGAVGALNLTDGRALSIPTEEIEITLKGGNCMRIHNSSHWWIWENQKPAEWREPPTFISAGDSGRDTGHLTELEEFFAAVREGGITRSAIAESYKSMLLFEAIRLSALERRIVTLDYTDYNALIQ